MGFSWLATGLKKVELSFTIFFPNHRSGRCRSCQSRSCARRRFTIWCSSAGRSTPWTGRLSAKSTCSCREKISATTQPWVEIGFDWHIFTASSINLDSSSSIPSAPLAPPPFPTHPRTFESNRVPLGFTEFFFIFCQLIERIWFLCEDPIDLWFAFSLKHLWALATLDDMLSFCLLIFIVLFTFDGHSNHYTEVFPKMSQVVCNRISSLLRLDFISSGSPFIRVKHISISRIRLNNSYI